MQTIFRRYTVQLTSLIVLSASLAACGGGGGSEASSANATQTPDTPSSTTPPAATTPTPVAANRAPTISGAPITSVMSGQAYNFVPSAADADQDNLQFSISSKPAWATFDVATGRLTGSPTSANAGSYEEIQISVTDGKAVTRLPQFAIVVTAGATTTRSIRVSWQPPLTNTDGSTLTDLKGYRIVYGTQPGVYTSSVPVNGTGLVNYMVENLEVGKTYYFSMVAVNASGSESDFSQEAAVKIS